MGPRFRREQPVCQGLVVRSPPLACPHVRWRDWREGEGSRDNAAPRGRSRLAGVGAGCGESNFPWKQGNWQVAVRGGVCPPGPPWVLWSVSGSVMSSGTQWRETRAGSMLCSWPEWPSPHCTLGRPGWAGLAQDSLRPFPADSLFGDEEEGAERHQRFDTVRRNCVWSRIMNGHDSGCRAPSLCSCHRLAAVGPICRQRAQGLCVVTRTLRAGRVP